MRKIKILALIFSVTLLLNSCGEYQRTVGKGTMQERYKLAVKKYEAKEYGKALRLFELVTPTYRGKPQMERIQFMVAQSNFNEKSYSTAAYYFDRFTNNYPNSSKKEEATFLSAYSYKLGSPVFSLDQTDTNKALIAFQLFINEYPDSDRVVEANKHYKELQFKLEKKAFEIGKTYYKTAPTDFRNYNSAIVAFDNLINDFLGTELKEEVLYYRFKAYHDLVIVSTQRKKEDRIKDAFAAYDKLTRNFPESRFLNDSDKLLLEIKNEQKQLVKS
jgi:outer membrane protein assembly factor BamD|tara:strand:+ start:5219 stop:6040 length:822 start_codon:yes stop_codon:yes gene_type:complete